MRVRGRSSASIHVRCPRTAELGDPGQPQCKDEFKDLEKQVRPINRRNPKTPSPFKKMWWCFVAHCPPILLGVLRIAQFPQGAPEFYALMVASGVLGFVLDVLEPRGRDLMVRLMTLTKWAPTALTLVGAFLVGMTHTTQPLTYLKMALVAGFIHLRPQSQTYTHTPLLYALVLDDVLQDFIFEYV